jgi:acetyl-CoA C-acetyltransferase
MSEARTRGRGDAKTRTRAATALRTNGRWPDVFVVGAARTPIGKFLGGLSTVSATDLGGTVVRQAVERSRVSPDQVEDVLMGQVLQAGTGQAPARQAALNAGLPDRASATTVNKVCASGLEAIHLGAARIQLDGAACVVAGGMESMSRAPHLLLDARTGIRLGPGKLVDATIHDGLWCPIDNQHMGSAAESIAELRGVSRDEMDQYSLNSHRKAVAAAEAGRFDDEIVPLRLSAVGSRLSEGTDSRTASGGTANGPMLSRDEPPRADATIQKLRELKPVFAPDGQVTAGNAPGLTDGAAAVVLADSRWAERNGLQPMSRITGYATAAVAPGRVFEAPELAIRKLLERTATSLDDYDLLEINEAFAAQILANGQALGWDWDRVNVNGGGIALGHPLGATGARIVVTLLHALHQRGLKRGLAGLCHGGGGAVAMSFEVV